MSAILPRDFAELADAVLYMAVTFRGGATATFTMTDYIALPLESLAGSSARLVSRARGWLWFGEESDAARGRVSPGLPVTDEACHGAG